jgi:DNA-binding NarL/FixJ family response regulator
MWATIAFLASPSAPHGAEEGGRRSQELPHHTKAEAPRADGTALAWRFRLPPACRIWPPLREGRGGRSLPRTSEPLDRRARFGPLVPPSLCQARKGYEMYSKEAQGLTCIVADDHPVVGEAIRGVLESHGVEVLAVMATGESALRGIANERPLIALVDMGLPDVDGAEVARRAGRVSPETAVIVFTGRSDFAVLTEALDAGARGFVLKEAPLPDLVRAIEMVAQGAVYVDPALASLLIETRGGDRLTPREREVLRLIADGLGNEQIGTRLFISPQTVRTHVGKAMEKLEVGSRTEAVAVALRHNLIA